MPQSKLIDISAHGDWPTAALVRTLDGIIIRCAYNMDEDSKFAAFAHEAAVAKLPWAAYHFIKPGDGVKQAELALRVTDKVGGSPVIFMDREWEYGVVASESTADAYINRLKKAGHTTGTYMSLSIYQNHGADIDWPALWSRLTDPILPGIFHEGDFLQIAGDGVPSGNRLDRDIYNGIPQHLAALFETGRVANPTHNPPIVAVPPVGDKGDVMFNLVPGVAKRVVTLKDGATIFDRSVGGTRYSASHDPSMQFAMLGGSGNRIVIADGDYGVYVNRADVTATITADKAYGK